MPMSGFNKAHLVIIHIYASYDISIRVKRGNGPDLRNRFTICKTILPFRIVRVIRYRELHTIVPKYNHKSMSSNVLAKPSGNIASLDVFPIA